MSLIEEELGAPLRGRVMKLATTAAAKQPSKQNEDSLHDQSTNFVLRTSQGPQSI
jgi:hypothetical protein